ncbi:MAG: uroporphyrinogen decarboxylase family protein [Clostridiales bacterium]|nr:uroporphyrinogen decarboxylase family protein [Clostridiales bacterium]
MDFTKSPFHLKGDLFMNEMTNRERIMAALNGKEVDRLPWAPLIDPYFINSLPLQGYDLNIIEAMRFIGNDIIERHVSAVKVSTKNLNIRTEIKGGVTRTYFETPVGTLYSETCTGGCTNYISKYLLSSTKDIKILEYIANNTEYTPDFEAFISRDKYIGNDGIATPSGPLSPIQEMLQSYAGIENTVYLMADYPDEIDELLNVLHERNKRHYRVLSKCPCGVIFDYEDTSTTVMSKNMYAKYSAPMIDDYAQIVHDGGKLFITHMCGKLTGFAEMIAQGNMDGIDSLCPPTTGDLYPWDARRIFGGDKVIIGGIEPPALFRMSIEESIKTVIKVIKKMPSLKSFILSTGDAVPYGTPIKNMIAITKLLKTLGSASLTGEFDEKIAENITSGI